MGPGLWSAAEAEVLVMSANLPLMSPIIQYLRGKHRFLSLRTPKDEESSRILELSDRASKKKEARSDNGTSAGLQSSTFVTTAEGSADKGGNDAGFEVPDNRILVEMDLEQRFTGRSAVSTPDA